MSHADELVYLSGSDYRVSLGRAEAALVLARAIEVDRPVGAVLSSLVTVGLERSERDAA